MIKRTVALILAISVLTLFSGINVMAQEAKRGINYELPPEPIELNYTAYFNGICDNLDTASYSTVIYDQKSCIKITPNVSTENGYINLDGYSYKNANIDLTKYGTAVFLYKYVTERPLAGRAELRLMPSGIFTGATFMESREELVANRWAVVSFDLTAARKTVKPDGDTVIRQLHYLPFGATDTAELLPDDELYVYKIYFFPEKTYGASYNNNYWNLTGFDLEGKRVFKPTAQVTRAQACDMIARLVADSSNLVPASDGVTGFTDIKAHTYLKHIEYLEDLGFLRNYSKAFSPDSPITENEFAELVHTLGIYLSRGKRGLEELRLTGFNSTVPKRVSGPISRANAIILLNSVLGRRSASVFEQHEGYYADLSKDHYAYGDILNAALGHISLVDENGEEYWARGVGNNSSALESFLPDYGAGVQKYNEITNLIAERAEEIRSTPNRAFANVKNTYYVSPYGDDSNDGLSEQTPFKTAAQASRAATAGDLVLFQRGGEWRERWNTKSGVTYSAYGYGAKPIFNGNTYGDVAIPSLWTLVEGTTNVYKFACKVKDIGNIVLNGTQCVTKLTPTLSGSEHLLNNKVFDPAASMTALNRFICIYDNVSGSNVSLDNAYSTLYFKCHYGNPGEYYRSIELCERGSLIVVSSNCHMDNLHLKYTGSHGFAMGSVSNVAFTNCEIEYIGGAAQYFTNGNMVRFGNGIEVFGSCDGFTVDNCYVYQCYDAGITHQHSAGGTNTITQRNVYYTNNLIDKCIYNIEYFLGASNNSSAPRYMENILYKGNILARSGGGWGYLPSRSASIVGWGHHRNEAADFVIEDNIFFADNYNCFFIAAEKESWLPRFKGNTYIRKYNVNFAKYGLMNQTVQYKTTSRIFEILENIVCEENPSFYFYK